MSPYPIDAFGLADVNCTTACLVVPSYLSRKANCLPNDLLPASTSQKNPHPSLSNATSEITPSSITVKPCRYLSNELWCLIMSYLPKSTLKEAIRVSQRFHAIGTRELYREVLLQTSSKRMNNNPYDRTRNQEFPWRDIRSTPPLKQQHQLVHQLLQKPQHALSVRTFVWTMGLETAARELSTFPYWLGDIGPEYLPPANLYQMFALCSNVTFLDLDIYSLKHASAEHLDGLFPRAEVVQLRGMMDLSLVKSILHGLGKAPLKRLVLDTIFDYQAARSSEVTEEGKELGIDSLAKDPPSGYANMLGHLTPSLYARCSNLDTLYLSKFGQHSTNQHDAHRQYPFNTSDEEDVYREWASFIAAVKPKRLFLKQFHVGRWDADMSGYSPMNDLFRRLLLPVLEEGWDGLERLELGGVGLDDEVLLRRQLKGVEIVVDAKVERFELLGQ